MPSALPVARAANPTAPGPVRLNFTHEELARFLMANPGKGQMGLAAAAFGYSQAWLSCIVHSDAFQARMRELEKEADTLVVADIPTKLRGVAAMAIDGLADAVEAACAAGQPLMHRGFLLDAAELTMKSLGYGSTKVTLVDNSIGKGAGNVAVVDRDLLERARGQMLNAPSREHAPTETPVDS